MLSRGLVRYKFSVIQLIFGPSIKKLPIIIFAVMLLAGLETLTVSMVIPGLQFANLVEGEGIPKLNAWLQFVGITDKTSTDEIVLWVLLIGVSLYLSKIAFTITLLRFVYSFALKNQVRLLQQIAFNVPFEYRDIKKIRSSSQYINSLIVNVETVTSGTIIASIRILSEIIILLFLIGFLLYVNLLGTLLVTLVMFSSVGAFYFYFRGTIRLTGEQQAKARAEIIEQSRSLFDAYDELRLIGRIDFFQNPIKKASDVIIDSGVTYKILSSLPRYVVEITIILSFGITLTFSFLYGLDKLAISQTMMVMGLAALRILPGLNVILSSLVQLKNAEFAAVNIAEIIVNSKQLEVTNVSDDNSATEVYTKPRIEISHLRYFAPNSSKPIIEDLNLKIPGPSLVCLTGVSGSGKTTLLRLISGALKPWAGTISINGCNQVHLYKNLKSYISFVPQKPAFFPGTVIENICLCSKSDVDQEKLNFVIECSGLIDVLNNLDDKLGNILRENGGNFSGGQLQRIAIARALYLNKKILLLDEPTSALDKSVSVDLINNLHKISKSKIVLIATHNKDFLEVADQVVSLK